jgi:diguanylate cyclase (GGDEF)-like protein
MDLRFCGFLASRALASESPAHATTYEMIWTFEPNVVFTAVQYLMARINAEKPDERERFETLLNASTPHSPSLRLALSLTTKLTMLMQKQNELEMATNRISSAISSTLDLSSILQSAVEEVGRALKSHRAAIVLWEDGTFKPEGMSIYERAAEVERGNSEGAAQRDPAQSNGRASSASKLKESRDAGLTMPPPLEVPITYRNSIIGTLVVEDDAPGRIWEDEEVLMVKTVSDQLAVAISHARLFHQMQTQAMTDGLTGLFNHRYFQECLDREINRADRNNDRVSLILLDLDQLKRINDLYGHRTGDTALRHVAEIMRGTVREVDICARYGGEEFVVILPQCGREDALKVAERLREAIATVPIPIAGQVTASLGCATYPSAAKTKEELVEMADRAMYLAKAAGRNKVRTLMHHTYNGVNL